MVENKEVLMKEYDYLIVGSGLFGAVFAHEAMKKGKSCLVIEKRNHIGGNIYTQKQVGIDVHKYGAHIFHTNSKVIWDYVNSFCEFNRYTNCPVANYKGEIYNLPFNMNTFNKLWGVVTPEEAKVKIAQQQKDAKEDPRNLEEQAIKLVGIDIYEKLVKGYTEKQWGRPCSELPAFIIKRLPVRFTYDNNYFNDNYQGIPVEGYTKLIEKLLDGAHIELNVDFNKDMQTKEKYMNMAKTVVYTGTIDSFYDYKFGKLEYRSLHFETDVLDKENYQGVAVMNYTDLETPYTRVIEHKHFTPEREKNNKTVITREYSEAYSFGKEPYYPVNDDKNQKLYEKYAEEAAKEKNVIFGGRLAEYKYYDMDKVIASALEAAKKI